MVWIKRGQTSYQGVEVMEFLPEATIVFNFCYAVFAFSSFLFKTKAERVVLNKKKIVEEESNFIDFLNDNQTVDYITKLGAICFLVSILLSLLYYSLTGRGLMFMLTLGQLGEKDKSQNVTGIYFLMQFIRSAIPGIMILLAFSNKHRFLIHIGAVILCLVCVSTGSRNLALCVMLAIIVYKYLSAGNRPNMLTIAAGIVLIYLFVGFIGIFRSTIKSGNTIDVSTMDSDSIFSAFMFNVEIFYPFYTLVGYLSRGIIQYHYGLGIINIPLQFIPHILWKSKPATIGLTSFEAMYGDSMGGAAYPNIGEFYYEFGLIGAMFGMILFGIFSQKYFVFAKKTKNKISMLEYGIFFGYIMQFICRGHFASWALDFVFMFGPIWFLKKQLVNRYELWTRKDKDIDQKRIILNNSNYSV